MRVDQSVSWLAVVFAIAFGVISSSARAEDGCSKDTDCKGDRVCNAEKQCVDPHSATNSLTDWLKVAQEAEKTVDGIKQARKQSAQSNDPADASGDQAPASNGKRQAHHAESSQPPVLAMNRPSPAFYRPAIAIAKVCATPFGMCPMMVAIPQGSSCGCATPRGMVGGIAR